MKLVAEYLEHAHQFERMADKADGPKLRKQFLDEAAAYRKLAHKRAEQLGLSMPLGRQSK